MKRSCKIVFLFLISLSLNSQDLNREREFTEGFTRRNIDPRQYVEVYMIDKLDNKTPIWKYNRDQTQPNQLRKVLDASSKIQIEFDKSGIAENHFFKGNITIEGKIVSTQGGEDPVEVFPYSRIGEEKRRIGITSRPPSEIANIFTNLLIESLEVVQLNEVTNMLEFPKKLNFLNSQLKNVIDYINYFKSSGEKAEDAFLSFINLDHIGLDNIESNLIRYNEEINDFFKRQDSSAVISSDEGILIRDLSSFDISNEIQTTYIDAIAEIGKLTQLRGTLIERLLFPSDAFIVRDSNRVSKFLEALIPMRSRIIEILAQKASEIIYLNLDYATINLQKERAQEGDYLYIYVVLEESSRRGVTGESEIIQKVLPIGSYELRDTRWKVKVSDSFLLIDRINQPDTNQNNGVSPSNFKGAPGVSLLLTRRNDGSNRNNLWNFLEPSIGINVSYVDFNRNDDVEIGTGLVIGLFNNKIFFSGGLNLNSTGQDEDSPYYFGVGFSFANLASKLIKDK